MRIGHQRRQSAGRQLAVGPASCSASARANTPRSTRATPASRAWTTAAAERAIKDSLAPFDRGSQGENPYKVQQDLQESMQNLVGIVRTEAGDAGSARQDPAAERARGARRRRGSPRVSLWLAHVDRRAEPAVGVRGDRALRRSSARRAAAATSATTIRTRSPEFGTFNIMTKQGRGGGDAGVARADPADARRV